jgi:hypothetical protein
MWPFSKKTILREISREFLRRKMEYDTLSCDVDTFSVWAVTYQDVKTGKIFQKEEWKLEF